MDLKKLAEALKANLDAEQLEWVREMAWNAALGVYETMTEPSQMAVGEEYEELRKALE